MGRITQVSHRFLPNVGGVERHVAELSRQLAARGHDVEVYTTDDVRCPDGEPPREPDGYRVRRFRTVLPNAPGFRHVLVGEGFYRALVRSEPDVIHAHAYAFYAFSAAWHAARRLGVPLVVTPHYFPGTNAQLAWPLRRGLDVYDATLGTRILARDAHAVCAVSPTEGAAMRERFDIDPARMHDTPNAVDLAECMGKPGFRDAYAVDEPFVLFLGRLTTQKDIHHLVRVAPRLRGGRVVIAGPDWDDGARLRRLAAELGAQERVLFTGALSRAMSLSALREARALVLCSHWETFGITILEAWANRTPVAVSDGGGMRDLVTHEVDGLVHRAGDEDALTRHLQRLLDDDALRRRLGAAGHQRVRSLFTWEKVAERVESAYGLDSGDVTRPLAEPTPFWSARRRPAP